MTKIQKKVNKNYNASSINLIKNFNTKDLVGKIGNVKPLVRLKST